MIHIIGAGPAGSYAAYLLSKKGEKVVLYEEHKEIGKPVQCTGIVTDTISSIIKIKKEFVKNKVKHARIYSPNKEHIDVKLKRPNIILDRAKFDKHLAEEAESAGAVLKLNSRFEGAKGSQIIINGKKIRADKIIGADGPLSQVAKSYGMYGKRKFVIGVQARVRMPINPDTVEFWLGIGQFAWLVPEDGKTARIGLIAKKKANQELKELLRLRAEKGKILDYQAGPIPIYNPWLKIKKGNVALIGDAATQVKATTYGGIIPGLIAAQEVSRSFDNYEKNFKKRFGKELLSALLIRRMMDRFKDKDYNQLVALFKKDQLKEIIETHDRDFPTRFILKLLLKEPRLIKFSKKLIMK